MEGRSRDQFNRSFLFGKLSFGICDVTIRDDLPLFLLPIIYSKRTRYSDLDWIPTATMTNKRQTAISRSIHRALLREQDERIGTRRYNVLTLILAFLSIWQIRLVRISAQLFKSLRNEVWGIDEVDYIDSFVYDRKKVDGAGIQPMGDLGYSGSV